MDSIFDSLSPPSPNQAPPPDTDVDALTAQATQMANEGGPGAHADEAEAWLKSQMQQAGAQPTTSIFSSYSPDGTLSTTKPAASKDQSSFSDVPGKSRGYDASKTPDARVEALKMLGASTVQAGGEYAEHATDAIANAFGQAASYIKNFGKEHETFDAGMVTPQERAAAKLMGIPDVGLTHGTVYKMTPDQRQALDDQTMKAWGLTPDQERARVEANMTGDLSSPDVVGGTLSQSLMANLAEKSANPRMADTRKYYELQDTVKAMDITAHPDQHTPDEVKAAAARIQSLKDKLSPTTWDQVKGMWDQAVAEPGKTAKALGYGFLIDPELALAPEAKLGTLTYGAKEAAALRAAQTARDLQGTSTAATAASEAAQRSGDVYGRVAARAEQAAAGAKRGRSIFDTLSSVGSGAGINAGIAASQQEAEQGYVREGSLAAPAIAGGVIGGVGHAIVSGLHGMTNHQANLPRDVPDTTTTNPSAGSPDATGKIKEPGAPLPPETPIVKEGTVPYYGGVSADGKVIHLDKNAPDHVAVVNREGDSVNVPAKELVAYHESVEYPLMHLEGPVDPAMLQLIEDKMGPHAYFESGVKEKLLKGESLSYAQAHDIATRSENHMVEARFNVDSKAYQEALKPHIAKVGEASKSATASDIPVDLDTKPYDNMGYPEQLKGAGARPDIDKGQRGAADKRLLPTGTVNTDYSPYKTYGESRDFTLPDGKRLSVRIEPLTSIGEGAPGYVMSPKDGGKVVASLDGKPVGELHYDAGSGDIYSEVNEDYQRRGIGTILYKVAQANGAALDKTEQALHISDSAKGVREKLKNSERGAADRRLIATGAVAGTGAAIGAAAAGPDNRTAGAVAGGLAGLALSSLHWGDMKPTRGFGKQEAGTFAGPLSSTWKGTDEAMATRMAKVGKTDEQIHLATGMTKLPDGKWSREISDHALKVADPSDPVWKEALGKSIPLSKVMNHPELEKAYPGLLDDMKITVNPDMKGAGGYDTNTGNIMLNDPQMLTEIAKKNPDMAPRSVLAHEVQHAIQQIEGFPRGSNKDYEKRQLTAIQDYLENRQEALTQQYMEAMQKGDTSKLDALDQQLRKISEKQEALGGKATENYKLNAGETQARNVQNRLDMTPEERAAQSPYKTQDFPNEIQTIRPSDKPSPYAGKYQRGSIDPELLKKMAKITGLTLLGGTLGAAANSESPGKGALYGAGLALVGGEIPFRRIFSDAKLTDLVKRREGVTANALLNAQEGAIKTGERLTFQKMNEIHQLAKKGSDREAITHAIQSGDVKSLDPKSQQAAKVAQDNFDSIGQQAMKEGVLHNMLDNYVTNLWKDTPARQEILDKLKGQTSTPMGTTSRFALQRYIPSIAEGKKLGLEPKTEDISEILGIYNNSMIRAMANKQLLEGLRKMPMDTKGNMMVMPAKYAPAGYVRMDHPLMEGWRVAPDIVKSLDYVYHTFSNNAALTALQGTNALAKKGVFALSMFHPMSLLQAHLLANPLWKAPQGVIQFAKSLAARSEAHKMYLTGMQGDKIDLGLRNGLMVSPPGQSLDNLNMQHALADQALVGVRDFMNKALPYSGTLTAGALKKALDFNDSVVWHGVHFGLKVTNFLQNYDRLEAHWARQLEKDPSVKVPSQNEIARQAAQFTNDVFGGLNLRRLADDATTELGKSFAQATTAPSPQRVAQLMLMAPDWKMSTIRTFMKSAGMPRLSTKDATALYQQYIFRGAVLYFTLFNAMNNVMSGHNIWENKDPLMLDNGDGTKTQLSKHFMEFPELAHDPAKFILNSMGPVPKELFEQLTGKEYLTTSGGPPMKGSRIGHAARTFLPISASPDMTPSQRSSGFVGFPQSGMTNEQKARNKEAAKQRAAEKRMNKLMSGG